MNKFKFRSHPARIACIQLACQESIDKNIENAIAFVKEAARQEAAVVCLPELFSTKYFAADNIKKRDAINRYGEKLTGPLVRLMSKTARELHVVLVGGSFYEIGEGEHEGKRFNSAPIFDSDGELVAVHRKAHIPNDPGYKERRYFDLGPRHVTVADTTTGKIGVGICFDQWFPKVAEEAADQGATALLYPTAIGHTNDEVSGYIPGDSGRWNRKLQHVLAGQAANNHLYVGMANRVGIEGDTRFFGESAIYDHVGDAVTKLGGRHEGISIADCNLGIVPILNKAWGFKKARRDDIQS